MSNGGFQGRFFPGHGGHLGMNHALCDDCPVAESGSHRFTYKPRSGPGQDERPEAQRRPQASGHRLQRGCWPRDKPESRGNHAHPVVTQGLRKATGLLTVGRDTNN